MRTPWLSGLSNQNQLHDCKWQSLYLNPESGSKAYVPFIIIIMLSRPSTHVAFLQLHFHSLNPLLCHSEDVQLIYTRKPEKSGHVS